jgi:hypothetical protein
MEFIFVCGRATAESCKNRISKALFKAVFTDWKAKIEGETPFFAFPKAKSNFPKQIWLYYRRIKDSSHSTRGFGHITVI